MTLIGFDQISHSLQLKLRKYCHYLVIYKGNLNKVLVVSMRLSGICPPFHMTAICTLFT